MNRAFQCYVLVVMLVFTFNCSGNRDTDGSDNGQAANEKVQLKDSLASALEAKLLEGVWWMSEDDMHAVFYVINDSLYYTEEQDAPYFIRLKDSVLTMSRGSAVFSFEVGKLTKDSLFLYDRNLNEWSILYKRND